MRKIYKYKKYDLNDSIKRKLREKTSLKNWHIVEEKEVSGFSSGAGCLLAIIFLPLALLGIGKYTEVTYEKNND